MALHKKIPFLRIIVPLCAGIITALYIDISCLAHVIISAVFLISLTALLLSSWKNVNTIFGIVFTISLMALGNVMFSLERKNVSELRHEEQLFTCTLEDYPEKRETGYRAKAALHTSQINDSVAPVKGSIMLYIRSDSAKLSFKPGDILTIRCIPERITNRGNPYEFDYRFYMENQGFKYMAFLTPDNITGSIGSGNMKLKYRALIVREKIIDMYRKRGIEDRNLALVAAMTVGDKTMLEPDQKESFIKAGIMHIMAVSGLHAVVLSMFVFKLLFFLKKRLNAVRVIIAIIFLWGFAFVTGLTPSVMRAALMFSFIHTGSLMKRPVNSMNSVFASAFVLILIKPSVIFDSGFLLSYFAVAFIIAFYKDLYMMFNAKTWLGDQIWQSAAVTLIAQAGVLPLTITFFNRFPVYFLAANLVIVPLSSLIIITGCIIPMVYPVMFLSEPLAFVLNRLTSFTEWLTVKAASIPGSSIEGIGMTMPECIMLTVIVSLSMYLITKKDGRMLNIILVFVLIAVIHNLFTSTGLKRSSELTVYNSPGETNIGIRTGVTMTVFSSDSTLNADINRHCSALGLRPKLAKLNEIPACIEVNGKKILVTNEITDYILDRSSPDFVILSGQRPVAQIAGLLEDFHGQVIVSSSAPQRYKIYGNTSSLPQNIQYVRTSGAYSTRL